MELFDSSGAMLEIALRSTLLVATAGLLCRVLHRARPDLRSAIWRTTFVVLAVLPFFVGFSAQWSVPVQLPVSTSQAWAPSAAEVVGSSKALSEPHVDRSVAAESSTVPWDASRFWVFFWLLGASLAAVRLGLGYVRAYRRVRSAAPVTCALRQAWLEEEATRLGLRSPVELLKSPEAEVPVAFKLPRPGLLLPLAADRWSDARYRLVLRHELCHLQRDDLGAQLTAQLVCCLYWLNPVVWWAARRFAFERERACDDRVLRLGARPTEYAGLLLAIARDQSGVDSASLATASMAGSLRLEQRLKAILAFSPKSGGSPLGRSAAWVVMCCLSAALTLLRPTLAQAPVEATTLVPAREGAPEGAQPRTVMRSLSHAQAEDVAHFLRNSRLLSSRGSIQADRRTESLILRELPDRIEQVLQIVDLLDIEPGKNRQVGISVLVRSILAHAPTEPVIRNVPLERDTELRTVMRSLSHVKAKDVVDFLRKESLLSLQGSIRVDRSTNTVILHDLPANLEEVLRVVDGMDIEPEEDPTES